MRQQQIRQGKLKAERLVSSAFAMERSTVSLPLLQFALSPVLISPQRCSSIITGSYREGAHGRRDELGPRGSGCTWGLPHLAPNPTRMRRLWVRRGDGGHPKALGKASTPLPVLGVASNPPVGSGEGDHLPGEV